MPFCQLLGAFAGNTEGVRAPVLGHPLQIALPLQLVDQRDDGRRVERKQLRDRGLALVGKPADRQEDTELARLDLQIREDLGELARARGMGASQLEAGQVFKVEDGDRSGRRLVSNRSLRLRRRVRGRGCFRGQNELLSGGKAAIIRSGKHAMGHGGRAAPQKDPREAGPACSAFLERPDQTSHIGDIGGGRNADHRSVGRVGRGVGLVPDMGGAVVARRRRHRAWAAIGIAGRDQRRRPPALRIQGPDQLANARFR